MTDRDMLLIAYGALRAIDANDSPIIKLLEEFLYPPTVRIVEAPMSGRVAGGSGGGSGGGGFYAPHGGAGIK